MWQQLNFKRGGIAVLQFIVVFAVMFGIIKLFNLTGGPVIALLALGGIVYGLIFGRTKVGVVKAAREEQKSQKAEKAKKNYGNTLKRGNLRVRKKTYKKN